VASALVLLLTNVVRDSRYLTCDFYNVTSHKIVVGKPEGGRPRRRWEDNFNNSKLTPLSRALFEKLIKVKVKLSLYFN
jgi:hypothetical protein